jgi:hypothetical protein
MINITTLYHKYIEKKKKVIYLILKKKPFQKEIIDQLESQLESKMNEFFDKIIDKIKETNFNNTEQSLKYILLKGLVLILEKELNKNKIDLSEGEKNTLKEIMENDDIHENKINKKGNLLFDEKEKEDINNEDNVEKVT